MPLIAFRPARRRTPKARYHRAVGRRQRRAVVGMMMPEIIDGPWQVAPIGPNGAWPTIYGYVDQVILQAGTVVTMKEEYLTVRDQPNWLGPETQWVVRTT